MADFLGSFAAGDTAKVLGWLVKDRATSSLLNLTSATNAKVYYRRQRSSTAGIGDVTPTLGGAAGSITIVPGAEAELLPSAGQKIRYDVWAEFDLSGKHYTVPDDGPDYFDVRKDR